MYETTGFIGKTLQGGLTTLGRAGSDLSATVIGAALRSKAIVIYKDVDGVLTADPRIVKTAIPVEAITYREAKELAYFGAKVVHPRCIHPVSELGIPIHVRNTLCPSAPGTIIVKDLEDTAALSPGGSDTGAANLVRAISCKRRITLVDIESTKMSGESGFLEKVFNYFERYEISVDVIATSDISISVTLDNGYEEENLAALKKCLESEMNLAVDCVVDNALITLIVPDHQHATKILVKCFAKFEELGINIVMMSHGATKCCMSFVVKDAELETAVIALHMLFYDR